MSIRRAQDERLEGTPDGLNAITEIMDVPDAPTIGTATDLGTGSTASVTFTASTTGGTATTYTVTSTPGSFTGTGASSPITVSGLSTSTAYTFKVKGTNATGVVGPESVASNSLTLAFPVDSGYDSLASVIVPSGGLSSITFAGIPTGYQHLQIRGIMRMSSNADGPTMRFNNDTTTSNYRLHYLQGNGTAASAGTISSNFYSPITMPNGASIFGGFVVDILDYNNTSKNKTIRTLEGFDANGSGYTTFTSGLWMSTSSITSIVMTGTTIQEFSTVALYGVK